MSSDVAGKGRSRRILCVVPAMGLGGAQRAMAMLVEHLCVRHDVLLLTWEPPHTRPFFPVPPQAAVLQADLLGGTGVRRISRILRRHPVLRGLVKARRPDVVISFIDTTNITAVLSCLGTGVPVVVSERADPSRHRIGVMKSWLRSLSYRFATRVVVQTNRIRGHFPPRVQDRSVIIPNGVPVPAHFAAPSRPDGDGRYRMIALGRLSPEKRFDMLMQAFAALAPRYPDWDLVIYGEGDEQVRLEALRDNLGLSQRIALPGPTSDPLPELVKSHAIACPSRYEGFPNALAEGMSVGLPAVGTAGVSGIEDLILDGETGFLVAADGGAPALAEALEKIISDDDAREQLGQAARRHLRNWYAPDVLKRWEDLIEQILAEKYVRSTARSSPRREQPTSGNATAWLRSDQPFVEIRVLRH